MERILVLNLDYTPLNTTSFAKGFNLVYKGKAEVLQSEGNPILTDLKEYIRPVIIRLLKYIRHRPRKIRVNRKRIYQRDGHRCGYCKTTRDLTIDHIMPKSRGGDNSWTNLVTCCGKCNLKKANRTPDECNMTLHVKPYEPQLLGHVLDGVLETAWTKLKQTWNA